MLRKSTKNIDNNLHLQDMWRKGRNKGKMALKIQIKYLIFTLKCSFTRWKVMPWEPTPMWKLLSNYFKDCPDSCIFKFIQQIGKKSFLSFDSSSLAGKNKCSHYNHYENIPVENPQFIIIGNIWRSLKVETYIEIGVGCTGTLSGCTTSKYKYNQAHGQQH